MIPKDHDPDDCSKKIIDTVRAQFQFQEPEELKLKKSLDLAIKNLEDVRNMVYGNNWTIKTSSISREIEVPNTHSQSPVGNSIGELRTNISHTDYDETLPPAELREDTLEDLLACYPEIIQKMKEGEVLNSCDRRTLGKQIFSRLCRYCRIPYDPSKKEKRIYFRLIFGTNNPSVPENIYISSTAGTRGYFDTYCMNSKATIKSQLEGISRKNKRKANSGEPKASKIRLENQNI